MPECGPRAPPIPGPRPRSQYRQGMAWSPENSSAELPHEPWDDVYWRDTYAWAMQQAEALRRQDWGAVDWDNLLEEIEDLGRSERRGWMILCSKVIAHLLTWEYWDLGEPDPEPNWSRSIRDARLSMGAILEESPCLQAQHPKMLQKAWANGRARAVEELAGYEVGVEGGSDFQSACRRWEERLPAECPYPGEQLGERDWWPEGIQRKFARKGKGQGR